MRKKRPALPRQSDNIPMKLYLLSQHVANQEKVGEVRASAFSVKRRSKIKSTITFGIRSLRGFPNAAAELSKTILTSGPAARSSEFRNGQILAIVWTLFKKI